MSRYLIKTTDVYRVDTLAEVEQFHSELKNDANFEKTVELFRTYFENGGVHFQLTYVSKEDLINAKVTPEDYKNLRVRVSGFSITHASEASTICFRLSVFI